MTSIDFVLHMNDEEDNDSLHPNYKCKLFCSPYKISSAITRTPSSFANVVESGFSTHLIGSMLYTGKDFKIRYMFSGSMSASLDLAAKTISSQ